MIVAIITVAIVMMSLITAVLTIAFVRYYKINKTKISLKESLDLINLPLITMENNGVKLNFLLDSGSNLSIINKDILEDLDYAIITDYETKITSFDGSVEVSNGCGMSVYYKGIKFVEIFSMSDNNIIFDEIKKRIRHSNSWHTWKSVYEKLQICPRFWRTMLLSKETTMEKVIGLTVTPFEFLLM